MSFHLRITLLAGAAVAIAVAVASAVVYVTVSDRLYGEIDQSLRGRVHDVTDRLRNGPRVRVPGAGFGQPVLGAPGFVQFVSADGRGPRVIEIPGLDEAPAVATGARAEFFADGEVDGVTLRVYTAQIVPGLAVQAARPLDETEALLATIRWVLIIVGITGIGVATLLGLIVARGALAPVDRLTRVAEDVTATRDLSRRIEVDRRDELGRLADSFNSMLGALESSQKAQRRLVADASHELRTPLASLRTNIEVLAGGKPLADDERRKLLADLTGQLEELSLLVGDLVELDRDAESMELTGLRLDELVAAAVARARVRSPGLVFEATLSPSVVDGSAPHLDRAVGNLLDNAAKWSPDGGVVEVTVAGGAVTVRDHGPGVPPDDLEHVFDRFYRATSARRLPGSGLGLAIVRQVAESHGGVVSVRNADDGGAVFTLILPAAGAPSDERSEDPPAAAGPAPAGPALSLRSDSPA